MTSGWSGSQEDEENARKVLFKKAGKGDRRAVTELAETYGVRIWTPEERQRLVYLQPVKPPKSTARRRTPRATARGLGDSGKTR